MITVTITRKTEQTKDFNSISEAFNTVGLYLENIGFNNGKIDRNRITINGKDAQKVDVSITTNDPRLTASFVKMELIPLDEWRI